MEKRRDVFQAIADPTRREIIRLLAGNPLNLNAIAENFNQARPTISQHVKFLEESGVIVVKKQGRHRICEAQLTKLVEVAKWVNNYKAFWNTKLDALEDFLDSTKNDKK